MSNTVAYQGRGCKLNLQTSVSPVVYTEVGQLSSVKMGGLKSGTIDITNLDSPSGFKEITPGIIDPGEISFDGILNPANSSIANLLALLQAQTLSYWDLALSDGVTHVRFYGYVTEYAPVSDVAVGKALTFSGKITLTGQVTIGS